MSLTGYLNDTSKIVKRFSFIFKKIGKYFLIRSLGVIKLNEKGYVIKIRRCVQIFNPNVHTCRKKQNGAERHFF